MKKAIIMSALAFAFSATSVSTIAQNSDAAIKVNGWDGFTPEPRIIEDKSMDDDASGRSTGSGDARVVKIQKPALSADNTSADINCENSRFAGLCSQLENEMAKRDAQMSASNQSYAQQVALQSENKAKAFADARANQAQNNAINSSKAYSNQKYSDAINYTNWKADDAYNKSVAYTNGKHGQAIRHADWRYNQAINHANWVRSDTRNYANNRANEAQRNANNHTNAKHNQAVSHGTWANTDAKNYAYNLFKKLENSGGVLKSGDKCGLYYYTESGGVVENTKCQNKDVTNGCPAGFKPKETHQYYKVCRRSECSPHEELKVTSMLRKWCVKN
ncbi:hypothetical protein [Photobacterium leiognathi]|uniref:hypothetical protein n=1 Tax=Photobacterium leiognathi TaxID=553611 RepID=UPI002980E6C6|nr:hypothetical protein [Photobacterium leiognathi]